MQPSEIGNIMLFIVSLYFNTSHWSVVGGTKDLTSPRSPFHSLIPCSTHLSPGVSRCLGGA